MSLVHNPKSMEHAILFDDIYKIIHLENAIGVTKDGDVVYAAWYMPYPDSHHLDPWEKGEDDG